MSSMDTYDLVKHEKRRNALNSFNSVEIQHCCENVVKSQGIDCIGVGKKVLTFLQISVKQIKRGPSERGEFPTEA